MRTQRLYYWWLAFRPKTLIAGFSPVILGGVLAVFSGHFHLLSFVMCLLTTFCIQVGTNLANDYHDYKKGADTAARLGPTRVTQQGLISPVEVKGGYICAFIAAFIFGTYLIGRGGQPIFIIGVLAIVFGVLYTAGPVSLAYLGLGDLFVLIFFGPVATAGTYYLQTLTWSKSSILLGLSPGLISMAILLVNNIRDIDQDRVANKKTLVVRLGAAFGKKAYIACLYIAAILPVCLNVFAHKPLYGSLTMLMLLFAIPHIRTLIGNKGRVLNDVLAQTGKLHVIWLLLYVASRCLSLL